MKRIEAHFADSVDARRVLRELHLMTLLDHPNVVKFVEFKCPNLESYEKQHYRERERDREMGSKSLNVSQIGKRNVRNSDTTLDGSNDSDSNSSGSNSGNDNSIAASRTRFRGIKFEPSPQYLLRDIYIIMESADTDLL